VQGFVETFLFYIIKIIFPNSNNELMIHIFNLFVVEQSILIHAGVCVSPGSAGRRKRDIREAQTPMKVVKRQTGQTLAQLALRSYGAQLT
jgi:hypothetical protein